MYYLTRVTTRIYFSKKFCMVMVEDPTKLQKLGWSLARNWQHGLKLMQMVTVSLELDWPINHSDQQYMNISV